jgi:dihydroneopterin aldolase
VTTHKDEIELAGIELHVRLGVPDDERATPQRITAHVRLEPQHDFQALGDAIDATVDYAIVWERIRTIAESGERRLIETLANELAVSLLREFPLVAVEVELRKFILPQTEYVAVRVRRERGDRK